MKNPFEDPSDPIAWFINLCGGAFTVILSIGLLFTLGDLITNPPKKKGPSYPVWKNWDESRPVTDIKSYDYQNKTVTYREYREPEEEFNWSYTYPVIQRKSHSILIDKGNITVTMDIDDILDNMTTSEKEDMIQEMIGDMDYNDLLDYYGSPEGR